jgi:phage tail-like protein
MLLLSAAPPGAALADTPLHPSDSADPLSFRVLWDGHPVSGIAVVKGLARHTEVATNRGGGDPNAPRLSPGLTHYEPLVLERRLTADPEFERWANKVWSFASGPGTEISLRDYRKDIRIEFFNVLGETVMAFRVYRCWPSDYFVMGEMDADHPSVPSEVLILQYEGWERDHEIIAPH